MKVTLSHVAKHHAYQTALALQEMGWLKRFYTSFYLEKNPSPKHQFLLSFLPKGLQEKMSNRYCEGLDESKVTSFYFPEILERTPFKNLIGAYSMMNLKGELYDRRVAMQDLECDVFHGFEGAVMHSFNKAKQQGAKIVLDYPIFHYHTIREIMLEEYKIFKIDPPVYLVKNDVNIIRKEREIEESDYVFVSTERIANDFIRYGKSRSQVKCVPYGFNGERFRVGKKKDNIFRILFVGVIGFRKGVCYLLEAFKQLRLKNAELLLVSPIEEDFKPILGRYNGLFRYVHSFPNAELPEVYQNSSVFVFPSLAEGSAYVTYEAMASGLPVIVSENSGAVTRDSKDGFIIPIRDIETLKQKILFLYEHEELRRAMGESAAEYVKEYTWENYRKKIRETYRTIIKA